MYIWISAKLTIFNPKVCLQKKASAQWLPVSTFTDVIELRSFKYDIKQTEFMLGFELLTHIPAWFHQQRFTIWPDNRESTCLYSSGFHNLTFCLHSDTFAEPSASNQIMEMAERYEIRQNPGTDASCVLISRTWISGNFISKSRWMKTSPQWKNKKKKNSSVVVDCVAVAAGLNYCTEQRGATCVACSYVLIR